MTCEEAPEAGYGNPLKANVACPIIMPEEDEGTSKGAKLSNNHPMAWPLECELATHCLQIGNETKLKVTLQ